MGKFVAILIGSMVLIMASGFKYPCCEEKILGGERYTLIEVDREATEFPYNCKNNCVYSKMDGGRFCFRVGGDKESTCVRKDEVTITPSSIITTTTTSTTTTTTTTISTTTTTTTSTTTTTTTSTTTTTTTSTTTTTTISTTTTTTTSTTTTTTTSTTTTTTTTTFTTTFAPAPYHSASFEDFKAKYGKSYENEEEEEKRKKIWFETVVFLRKHNQNYIDGLHSFQVSENEYADFTLEEVGTPILDDLTPIVDNVDHEDRYYPAEWNWVTQGFRTPVRNQGICISSSSFSAVGAMEGVFFRITGRSYSFSVQEVIDCCYGSEYNVCDQGATAKSVFKCLDDYGKGLAFESVYPYKGVQQGCQVKAPEVRLESYIKQIPANEQVLKNHLYLHGPIAVELRFDQGTLRAFNTFNGTSDGDVFDIPCGPYPTISIYVLIVGYGKIGEKNYWSIKNSWGTNWGKDGYAKVPRDTNWCGIKNFATLPVTEPKGKSLQLISGNVDGVEPADHVSNYLNYKCSRVILPSSGYRGFRGAATSIGQRIVVCGGYDRRYGTVSSECKYSDMLNLGWNLFYNLKMTRYAFTLNTVGNYLVAFGGMSNYKNDYLDSVEVRDITGSITIDSALHPPRCCHCAVTIDSENVLFFGGFNDDSRLNIVQQFNAKTGKLTELPYMKEAVSDAACVFDHNDNAVYITGGKHGSWGSTSEVYMYFVKFGTYDQLEDLDNTRRFHGAIYDITGMLSVYGGEDEKTYEIYNADKNEWTKEDIPIGVYGSAGLTINC